MKSDPERRTSLGTRGGDERMRGDGRRQRDYWRPIPLGGGGGGKKGGKPIPERGEKSGILYPFGRGQGKAPHQPRPKLGLERGKLMGGGGGTKERRKKAAMGFYRSKNQRCERGAQGGESIFIRGGGNIENTPYRKHT